MTIVRPRLGVLAASVWFALIATRMWWIGRERVNDLLCIVRAGDQGCIPSGGVGWAHRLWGAAAVALWTLSLVLVALETRDRPRRRG